MNRTTFSILFFIKKQRLLKNGEAPIYMRITMNGKHIESSIKRSINISCWDPKKNKCKGTNKNVKPINDYIESIKWQLYNSYQKLQEQGKEINAQILMRNFLGIGEKTWKLIQLFIEHNNDMEMLINKDYAPLTLERYKAALNHLQNYIKEKYIIDDIVLTEVNHTFITNFEQYLKVYASCQHNTAMKHIKALKKIINLALANDYIKKDPFVNFKITTKEVKRNVLNKIELDRLVNKEITIPRLDVVRDLFIFQCYTGLSFSDLEKLTKNNVQYGMDNFKWLFFKRQKTGNECRVPLFSITERLIDKYANHPQCKIKNVLLPVPSNQKMNAYLKEIASICGIDKELHSHLARHTYATTVTLGNNIPLETVSKLLGHKKIQTTQIYAKVLDTKVSQDMDNLRKMIG